MGCDIHAFLEVRRYKHDDTKKTNGIWVNADKWMKNQYSVLYEDETERPWEISYDDRIWGSRWYFLFAILADVRNAWDVKPISEPKGFPDDASPEVVKENEHWGVDGHSHTWLTMREIVDWSGWDKPVGDEKSPRELLSEFWEKVVGRMQGHLNSVVTPDDVRMVFWFDN